MLSVTLVVDIMEAKYSIGKVHKVYPNKLIIEIPDKEDIHYVYNGEFYETKGINTFVTIYSSLNELFIFQIIGLYEQEKPLVEDESAKLTSHAYFECIPIGEIKNAEFEYGLLNYPMIGDQVFLTSTKDLDIIFEKDDFSLELGTIPSQNNYTPRIGINDLFTHHMSILGNTNSGKSTTARKIIQKLSESEKINKEKLNFFIFDIHDEYDFLESHLMNSITMDEISISLEDLTIEDWVNLVRPSDKVQLPVLRQALKLSYILNKDEVLSDVIKVYCAVETFKGNSSGGVTKRNLVIELLDQTDFIKITNFKLFNLYDWEYAKIKDDDRKKFHKKVNQYFNNKMKVNYNDFYDKFHSKLQLSKSTVKDFNSLLKAIEFIFLIEESHGNQSIRGHTSTLVTRIEELKINYENDLFSPNQEKQDKLMNLLALDFTEPFIRFDVSSLTDEDLLFFSSHILERIYRKQVKQRKKEQKSLVHCIFDEAHQYIREHFQEERLQSLHVFEKIAREGRKFGLFMMVISQRPSELSQTVLSQCNNYILHRIRNSVDLEFMRKSIPYVTNHQLTRLSYMKSGTAILVGEAFSIPMELEVEADDDVKAQSKTYVPSEIWKIESEKEE